MFETFEHQADVGIRGINDSLESAFSDVGKALFSVMVDLDSVKSVDEVSFEVESKDLVGLLVDYLNELIFLRDTKNMFFCDFEVDIEDLDGRFVLRGIARGSKFDPEKQEIFSDVKSATFYKARVGSEVGKFVVQCVLDV